MTTRRRRGASSARRGGTAMNAVRLLRGLRRKDVNEVSRALDVERRGNDVDFMEKVIRETLAVVLRGVFLNSRVNVSISHR
eukprot:1340336-Amorphochlora_amoeboformis.AAC.1